MTKRLGVVSASAALLVAALAAGGGRAATPATPVNFQEPMTAEMVNTTLAAFAGVCRPLVEKYWGDIVAAEMSVGASMKPQARALGDMTMIEFVVSISDNPKAMDRAAPRISYAGHRCFYQLYGGAKPRVVTSKQVCKWLCGLSPDTAGSADAVINAPALAVIGVSAQAAPSSLEAQLSTPSLELAYDPVRDDDGQRAIEGWSASRLQAVQLIGPADRPVRAKVMVDLRRANATQSRDFMVHALKVLVPGGDTTKLTTFVDANLKALKPGQSARIKAAGSSIELNRQSDVMATLAIEAK